MGPKPAASDPSRAGKRKGAPPAGNGRSDAFMAKRAKVFAARNIPTQPAEVALKDGELDLAAFVAAHEFEIRALEQSMATTKAVSASRAFQIVPRELRRRTASHNPKRVPKRLRARAKREMDEDNAPLVQSRRRKPRTLRARIRMQERKRLYLLAARKSKRKAMKKKKSEGQNVKDDKDDKDDKAGKAGGPATKANAQRPRKPRPKIRRNVLNEPPKPPAKFRKRQQNKTWLPTHRWHAKRARMTPPKDPLWRFAIPLTPNEKVYRPTHRAQGQKGTLVWDMSYMSTIGVYGNLIGMERVLRRIGLFQDSCWNDRGKKWRQGSRAWTGMLSCDVKGTRSYLCPATVLWNPQPQSQTPKEEGAEIPKKQKMAAQSQVYVRVHPSAFLQVFNELLRLVKMENPRLYIEDLRFEIGSIDLSGPASTEALHAILTPYPSRKNKHAELFRSLRGLSNPAALPANVALHFQIQDPRLRYPPRKAEPPQDEEAAHMALLETIARWPAEEGLEPSPLFDRNARHAASCLPSQKAINRRRGKAHPGSFLKPVASLDPAIPIALLSSRGGNNTQTQGTWTLLAPWACILPLWYSLVHTPLTNGGNPRFAGINEIMQISFERGLPWFPADLAGTRAGAEWEAERARKRRSEWSRRPKSKRVAWESLDLGAGRKGELGDGLACDFGFLFGLPKPREAEQADQVASADAMDVDDQPPATAKEADRSDTDNLLTHVSKPTFQSLLTLSSTAEPPPSIPPRSIICVRISILGRGVVRPPARIYRLPTNPPAPAETSNPIATIPHLSGSLPSDLRSQWLARIPSPSASAPAASRKPGAADAESRQQLLAQELTKPPPPENAIYQRPNQFDIGGQHPLVPDARDLIGFVTTGGFCLASGSGRAVGSIALERVLAEVRKGGREARLCIVRNAGENVGWLARWEVV